MPQAQKDLSFQFPHPLLWGLQKEVGIQEKQQVKESLIHKNNHSGRDPPVNMPNLPHCEITHF